MRHCASLAVCLLFAVPAGGAAPPRHVSMAYAWSPPTEGRFENIVPLIWLRPNSDPSDVKQAADRQPEGHRVLFSWNVHRGLHKWEFNRLSDEERKRFGKEILHGIDNHPEDRILDAGGEPVPSIWWNHGVRTVRERFDHFFEEYKAKGGKIDYLVLDFEGGMSNWHIGGGKSLNRWQAIQSDPRFTIIAEELGFRDLTKVIEFRSGTHYLRWNELMSQRKCEYLHEAVFEPVRKHFPEVAMSNYGTAYHDAQYPVGDVNGHPIYRFGRGAHVGTHQAPSLYCGLGRWFVLDVRRQLGDARAEYATTPFNGFRRSLNVLRACRLAADVPVSPWVASRSCSGTVRESDLYQEFVFHAGLTRVDRFLFFNPLGVESANDPQKRKEHTEEMRLFSRCLQRLDELVGFENRQWTGEGLVPWDADFALSGTKVPGQAVWRFTPENETGRPVDRFVKGAQPLVLETESARITFSDGAVRRFDEGLSTAGLWIVTPPEVRPEVVRRLQGESATP